MGDRGNIAVIQSRDNTTKRTEQVWFYGHWSGTDMPEMVREALARKQRWRDESYLARIIFCALLTPDTLTNETGFGISTRIQDNEHPITVVDIPAQTVYSIEEGQLDGNGQVPFDYRPEQSATFEEYVAAVPDPA